MPIIRTILHPTDLSETSKAAFQFACALARDYSADLLVLHVYPPPVNGADAVDRDRNDDIETDLLLALHNITPHDANDRIDYRVEEGSPTEVILDAARNCDLVVMGTQGRDGLSRAIMGSVAEHVLRESSCPVVTVRPTANVPGEVPIGGIEEGQNYMSNAEVVNGC